MNHLHWSEVVLIIIHLISQTTQVYFMLHHFKDNEIILLVNAVALIGLNIRMTDPNFWDIAPRKKLVLVFYQIFSIFVVAASLNFIEWGE